MSIVIDVETYLQSCRLPTIDVRSPGEFGEGHIPGAINVPLFDNAERAEVGTLYKQAGRQAAMVRGLQLAGAKADQLLNGVLASGSGRDCFLHCWRGGMRSEAMAWFLTGCEFKPQRIAGGYKAFRQAAHRSFAERRRIIILAGASGSGKTRLLSALRDAGEQVIDLEHLAGHRGSVFGGINRPPQPTVEQFENELFLQWRTLDADRPVWLECESQGIGRVFIPAAVWNQMSLAPAIFLEVDRARRVEFLVEEYGELPTEDLARAITKISKRMGGARLQAALAALERNDVHAFAELALQYYDKAYTRSLEKRPRDYMNSFPLSIAGQTDSITKLCQMGLDLTAEQVTGSVSANG